MTGNPPKPDDWGHDPDNITGKYIIKHRKPIPCPDLMKWGQYMQRNRYRQRVRSTYIGTYRISTVFLWIDHNHSRNGEPVLFETMVFTKDEDDKFHYEMERTTSWRKALKQHWAMVERVKHG